MTDLDRRLMLGAAGIAGAALAARLAQARSLNPPPGPVAPTGKTTDQIEPRIDLLNAPAAANVTSDANAHYIINDPGSYYLSANLAVSKSVGIQINADGVVLDLSGFQVSAAGGTGVAAVADVTVVVRNGSFSGCGIGVDVGATRGSRLEDLAASDCVSAGFSLGYGTQAARCSARSGAIGFYANESSALVDCAAIGGSGGFVVGAGCALSRCLVDFSSGIAFDAPDGCTFRDCTARNGSGDAIAAFRTDDGCTLTGCTASANTVKYGFVVGEGCTLRDCTAYGNASGQSASAGFQLAGSAAYGCVAVGQATSLAATKSNGAGFVAGSSGNVFEGCLARGNTGAGFQIGARNVVAHSHAVNNAFAGIDVTGGDNVIEGNRLSANSEGLLVEGTANTVFSNYARLNLTNYSIVAGNRVATIVAPAVAAAINGSAGGTAFTTDTYANIAAS